MSDEGATQAVAPSICLQAPSWRRCPHAYAKRPVAALGSLDDAVARLEGRLPAATDRGPRWG